MSGPRSQRDVKVGARTIHLTEVGRGDAVLMLHGGGPGASGLSNYSRNIDELAKRFRVLVPDMPGYGASSKGLDQKDPFGDLAGAMTGLLDALGVARTHVVGNSLGGGCALRMALDHPTRIDRLVLMGPGGVNTTRGFPTAGLRRLLGYYGGSGPSLEKLRACIGDLVFEPEKVPEPLIEERYRASIQPEVIASPPLKPLRGFPNFKIDFTRDKRLAALANPTLVLWGTEDRVNRPSGGATLQKTLKNCDLYLFSRTGHWVQWERADEFNAVTAAFLENRKEAA